MFKKNRTLSLVGLVFAMTFMVWFDKPWEGNLTFGQKAALALNIVSGVASIWFLVKSLHDGTYGE